MFRAFGTDFADGNNPNGEENEPPLSSELAALRESLAQTVAQSLITSALPVESSFASIWENNNYNNFNYVNSYPPSAGLVKPLSAQIIDDSIPTMGQLLIPTAPNSMAASQLHSPLGTGNPDMGVFI